MCFSEYLPLNERSAGEHPTRCYMNHRLRGILSGRGRLLCLLVLTVGIMRPGMARAQNSAGSGGATSDVTQLIQDMDDIDGMRPLLPLKLTPEQLDKMIAALTAEQNNYDKKMKAIAGPALAKLADQIHDVKQRTLKGEPIPKDFDVVVKQAENEILGKRKTLDAETLASVANSLQETFTPEQVKLAAKLDKDAQTKLGKVTANTQRTETQWFVSYVKDAVITSPRIVPVLKQMRAASNAKTASAGANNGK